MNKLRHFVYIELLRHMCSVITLRNRPMRVIDQALCPAQFTPGRFFNARHTIGLDSVPVFKVIEDLLHLL